jgi:peroxiredoxin
MSTLSKLLLGAAALACAGAVMADATVGAQAPAFTARDTHGKTVKLADYAGKYVVLEWVNPSCPFVKKHYDNSGNLPATQKDATAKGVVWLSVSTTDQAGAQPADIAALNEWTKAQKAVPTATLVDSDGKVGKAYGAKTTPHIYLIDPKGKLLYAGGIDNKPSSNAADIAGATNYVKVALDEALAGKPVSNPVTKPYGCSVKYGANS